MIRRVSLPALLLAGLVANSAPGQDGSADAAREDRRRWFEEAGRVMVEMQKQPWEMHYGYMMDAMERIYARNGWESESDRFSLDLMREVEAIPPWSVQERFDTLVGVLSDRYYLDERQERRMRGMIMRDANQLFRTHAGRIMEYGLDIVQTRLRGEAFTPEKVQRWTTLARPVLDEMQKTMERSATEFMADLDPEQQAMIQRDLGAAQHRMSRFQELFDGWTRGEWEAADWGMEEDPIQMAGLTAETAAQLAAEPGAPGTVAAGEESAGDQELASQHAPATDPPHAATGPDGAAETAGEATEEAGKLRRPEKAATEDPWAQYTRAFISRFKLNDEQAQRAWLVYRDAKTRRERVLAREAEIAKSRAGRDARSGAETTQPAVRPDGEKLLDRIFDQMKRRLERLPTSAQRRAAEPAPEAPTAHGNEKANHAEK